MELQVVVHMPFGMESACVCSRPRVIPFTSSGDFLQLVKIESHSQINHKTLTFLSTTVRTSPISQLLPPAKVGQISGFSSPPDKNPQKSPVLVLFCWETYLVLKFPHWSTLRRYVASSECKRERERESVGGVNRQSVGRFLWLQLERAACQTSTICSCQWWLSFVQVPLETLVICGNLSEALTTSIPLLCLALHSWISKWRILSSAWKTSTKPAQVFWDGWLPHTWGFSRETFEESVLPASRKLTVCFFFQAHCLKHLLKFDVVDLENETSVHHSVCDSWLFFSGFLSMFRHAVLRRQFCWAQKTKWRFHFEEVKWCARKCKTNC